jgi:type II secretory pathway pseudopilin PulG
MRHRNEVGETLVEIVLTIVIIGLAVAALLAGLGTAASASKSHRDLATADVVMRDYAEATKTAVRGCTSAGTYTVTYAPPAFTVSGAGTTCPSTSAAEMRTLQVTWSGHTKTMQIMVRTP